MINVESTAFSCNFEKRLCSSFEIISASLFEALQFLIPAIFDNTDILVSNRNIQSFHICTLLYLMVCQCLLISFKSNQHFQVVFLQQVLLVFFDYQTQIFYLPFLKIQFILYNLSVCLIVSWHFIFAFGCLNFTIFIL